MPGNLSAQCHSFGCCRLRWRSVHDGEAGPAHDARLFYARGHLADGVAEDLDFERQARAGGQLFEEALLGLGIDAEPRADEVGEEVGFARHFDGARPLVGYREVEANVLGEEGAGVVSGVVVAPIIWWH